MVIGVMSDTHRNVRLMHAVADMLQRAFAAEALLHLGDDYHDAELLEMAGHTVYAVPGLWCPEYGGSRVPKTRTLKVGGFVLGLVHAEQDLLPVRKSMNILLSGHSHIAQIVLEQGVVRMNPGHLKRPLDRGQHASFGLIDIADGRVCCSIHEADGRLRYKRVYVRAESGCLIPAQ